MIEAERRGKLAGRCASAHPTSEDLLTSTVFGLLRYVPWEQGIGAIVRAARAVTLDGDSVRVGGAAPWSDAVGTDGEVTLWPRAGAYGEPDVLAMSHGGEGRLRSAVIVEVKLFSSKSSSAEDGEVYEAAVADPDQLVSYWQWLRSAPERAAVPHGLVYLTAHATPPLAELHGSLSRAPAMRLAWLSWRDVWAVVAAIPRSRPAADLAALLAHRGLTWFDGFAQGGTPPSFVATPFWSGPRWFTARIPVPTWTPTLFWRST